MNFCFFPLTALIYTSDNARCSPISLSFAVFVLVKSYQTTVIDKKSRYNALLLKIQTGVCTKMTKMSIARGTALSALGYGAFEILGGITEGAGGGTGDDDEEQVQTVILRIYFFNPKQETVL